MRVWRAVEALNVDLKMALLLRDIVGLSYTEIADSLEITLATVKWRIYKAREEVQAALAREGITARTATTRAASRRGDDRAPRSADRARRAVRCGDEAVADPVAALARALGDAAGAAVVLERPVGPGARRLRDERRAAARGRRADSRRARSPRSSPSGAARSTASSASGRRARASSTSPSPTRGSRAGLAASLDAGARFGARLAPTRRARPGGDGVREPDRAR